jgi:predicted DNA binding protein
LEVSQKGKTHIIDYDELAYNAISIQHFDQHGVLYSSYTVMAANVKVKFASDCQWVKTNK